MTREEHEQKKMDEQDMEEMLANYRAVRSMGKWVVGIVIFIGAVAYMIVQIRHAFMK